MVLETCLFIEVERLRSSDRGRDWRETRGGGAFGLEAVTFAVFNWGGFCLGEGALLDILRRALGRLSTSRPSIDSVRGFGLTGGGT
jgi:hypothetical protein